MIARVFRYRPAEVVSSGRFVVGHDVVCLLIVSTYFFTDVLATEMGIRLRRRSRFCQVSAVKWDEKSYSKSSCKKHFQNSALLWISNELWSIFTSQDLANIFNNAVVTTDA